MVEVFRVDPDRLLGPLTVAGRAARIRVEQHKVRYILSVSHISNVCTGIKYLESMILHLRDELHLPLDCIHLLLAGNEFTPQDNILYAPMAITMSQFLVAIRDRVPGLRGPVGQQDTPADIFNSCYEENEKRMSRAQPGRNDEPALPRPPDPKPGLIDYLGVVQNNLDNAFLLAPPGELLLYFVS
jgi:hypothetical protein